MTHARPVRLGTRSSALARWQADWVAAQLALRGIQVEMVYVHTHGDNTNLPIGSLDDRGVFTKEIQQALLDDAIDVAVHSLKDLPTEHVAGLILAAVPEREHPGDCLVARGVGQLSELPQHARVGTGSLRRRAQLLHLRADLEVTGIRGNVDTRLRKLDDGQYDAIILAQAGLSRLGLQERISQRIAMSVMLPAVGQGALGIETRADDQPTRDLLAPLDHQPSRLAISAERELLRQLRGGCLAPIGAWARLEDGRLRLDAVVLSGDGQQRLGVSLEGAPAEAVDLGARAARDLREQGADELITAARQQE